MENQTPVDQQPEVETPQEHQHIRIEINGNSVTCSIEGDNHTLSAAVAHLLNHEDSSFSKVIRTGLQLAIFGSLSVSDLIDKQQ